jgi:hypothetical protein
VTLFEPTPEPDDPHRLAVEAGRTSDRLRSMSLTRLDAPLADGRSRAGAAFGLAQQLADWSAELSGRPSRSLPRLASAAAGDVLAVCAQDLVDDLRQHPGGGAARRCREAVTALIDLRRQL